MHYYYLLFFIFSVLITSNFCKLIEIQCPSQCKCDIFQNFKRANCTNQKLVVIEVNLPKETELLDLSYNQISNLENGIFIDMNLLSLKLLNISHNKVAQIHMNAFEKLDELKTLDLSYNAMRYLLPHWFWSLKSLQEVYFRGNSFQKITEGPQFESKTLKILDLSKCSISYIGNDTFTKIPNLEILDLSENNLIQLDVATITPLKNLTVLKVDNNPFECSGLLEQTINYCLKSGIKFKNPCEIKPHNISNKFERIINMVETENTRNSWIFDDGAEIRTETKITEGCNNGTSRNKNLLTQIINLSPIFSIIVPFVYGIALGILIGCTVRFRRKTVDSEESTYISYDDGSHLRRSSSLFRRKQDTEVEAHESLMLSEWNIYESTPVSQRKNQAT